MQCCRLLIGANALPPDPAVRESLSDVIAIMRGEEPGYAILSRTPLSNYPERGRRELEALMVRRSVLANFLRNRCQVLSLVDIGGQSCPSLRYLGCQREPQPRCEACTSARSAAKISVAARRGTCAAARSRASRLAEEAPRIRGLDTRER
jgi:hypothetical protein